MARKNEIIKVNEVHLQSIEEIENLIIEVRGKQTMLDRDIAQLYGVDTKRLNEQVRRNIERFPERFRFQLTDNETTRSDTAVSVSIQIMDAFTAMRHFLASNAPVLRRLDIIERNQLALNAHQEELSDGLAETNNRLEEVFRRLDDGSVKPTQGIFYDGQVFDAYIFVNDRIREAKNQIVLIDNYVDDSVLKMLDKRDKGVVAKIYSKLLLPHINVDIAKHNAQYEPIEVELFDRAHDRFLCIDDTVYHIGASLKDLGKKWFAFSKMEMTTDELLKKI